MKPFTRTIINLFDGKKRYLIPLYQRQYAWGVHPELELLWADIVKVADRLEMGGILPAPHFMGAMVISQIKTYGKQVQAYEVIDGQQRLTTFQLLLAAVRDVSAQFAAEYDAEAAKYLLNEGVMEDADVERFKLWPSLVDRRAFTRLIDPAHEGASTPHVIDEGDGVVRPAVAAHAYFVEKIRNRVASDGKYDPFRMEKLFEAMKDGLAVVSIELEGGDDPQTIFETLNSRGRDLSAGDLMRNFVFHRAVGMGQDAGSLKADKLYERYWLPLDRWFWRERETRGRLTRDRLDWMLVDHLAMKKADLVSAETLFPSYRSWVLDTVPYSEIETELREIAASAEIHRRVVQQEKSDVLGRYGRFARAFDVSTTMPLVMYLATEAALDDDGLAEALHLLESYIVRRDLCGLPTNNYNRFFVDAIAKLRTADEDRLSALRALLATQAIDISRWPDDAELARGWLLRPQYKPARQPRLRYVLEAIEHRKRSTISDEIVEIKTDLTLEHIMPRKWQEHWGIAPTPGVAEGELDMEQAAKIMRREEKVHLIGNLTLLTQELNSTVSNGPFSVKMPAVQAQAALILNRELCALQAWDEDAIDARGVALFDIARRLWSGPPAAAAAPQTTAPVSHTVAA